MEAGIKKVFVLWWWVQVRLSTRTTHSVLPVPKLALSCRASVPLSSKICASAFLCTLTFHFDDKEHKKEIEMRKRNFSEKFKSKQQYRFNNTM